MPRLFSKSHRERLSLSETNSRYHGDACEATYLEGMSLLDGLQYLKSLIRDRKLAAKNKARHPDSPAAFDTALSALDPRTTAALIAAYKETTVNLKAARVSYMMLHLARHCLSSGRES